MGGAHGLRGFQTGVGLGSPNVWVFGGLPVLGSTTPGQGAVNDTICESRHWAYGGD